MALQENVFLQEMQPQDQLGLDGTESMDSDLQENRVPLERGATQGSQVSQGSLLILEQQVNKDPMVDQDQMVNQGHKGNAVNKDSRDR